MTKLYFIIIILITSNCNKKCEPFSSNKNNIYGIDVSHYQNEVEKINWTEVKQNTNPKIDFVYIRSTMGVDGVDTTFKYNFENARKNNLKVGIYHYFRPNESGLKQFKNFKKHNKITGDLPVAIDIEKRSRFGGRQLRKELLTFIKLIENEYPNIELIIYSPQQFYNIYIRNQFKNYEFWIARHNGIKKYPENNQIKNEPYLLDKTCPLIWQYSATGTVKGIKGPVDLNIMKEKIW